MFWYGRCRSDRSPFLRPPDAPSGGQTAERPFSRSERALACAKVKVGGGGAWFGKVASMPQPAGPQDAALRARLLGTVDLQLDDQPLAPLDSARAESLLAYLLLHRDAPQPRQRLAFQLWPGSAEGQAQTNLRKVLHTLRRALPDADRLIEIGPRTLHWRADVPLWLDVEQFERALAEDRLEEAVEIYGGELLEGRYDEWLSGDRSGSPGCTPTRWSGSPAGTSSISAGPKPSAAPSAWSRGIPCVRRATGC